MPSDVRSGSTDGRTLDGRARAAGASPLDESAAPLGRSRSRLRDRGIPCRRCRHGKRGCSSTRSRKRDVGADAEDRELRERGDEPRDREVARLGRRRSPWRAADRSGPTPRRPRATPESIRTPGMLRLAVEQRGGRPAAGTRARDPRRRRAPRSRGRAGTSVVLAPRQRLARRDEQLRAHEVDARHRSVTGCSTCSRVFISRK